jgi:small subunit ribosomal protein S3
MSGFSREVQILIYLYSFSIDQLLILFGFRDVTINIIEIVDSNSDAVILSYFIKQQLEKRIPFRRVIKNAILKTQNSKLRGIKIQLSGRLNGAEIARTEWIREGSIPLHTIRANLNYCSSIALLFFLLLLYNLLIFSSSFRFAIYYILRNTYEI